MKKLRLEAAQIRMALSKAQLGVFASNGTTKSNNPAPDASAIAFINLKDSVKETGVAAKTPGSIGRASTVASSNQMLHSKRAPSLSNQVIS